MASSRDAARLTIGPFSSRRTASPSSSGRPPCRAGQRPSPRGRGRIQARRTGREPCGTLRRPAAHVPGETSPRAPSACSG
eukprot:5836615-Alexandrium_andersonii.AAC.1